MLVGLEDGTFIRRAPFGSLFSCVLIPLSLELNYRKWLQCDWVYVGWPPTHAFEEHECNWKACEHFHFIALYPSDMLDRGLWCKAGWALFWTEWDCFIAWPSKDLCWDRGACWAVSSHGEEVSVKKQEREYIHTTAVCPAGSTTGCAVLEQHKEDAQPVAAAPAGPLGDQMRSWHSGGCWWGQTEANGVMGLCFWSCSVTVRKRNVLSKVEWIVMKRRYENICYLLKWFLLLEGRIWCWGSWGLW